MLTLQHQLFVYPTGHELVDQHGFMWARNIAPQDATLRRQKRTSAHLP